MIQVMQEFIHGEFLSCNEKIEFQSLHDAFHPTLHTQNLDYENVELFHLSFAYLQRR